MSDRFASRRQKRQGRSVLHSEKFHGYWPKEEWTAKRMRFIALASNVEGETCDVPVASQLDNLRHLRLNYGKKWRSEMAPPLYIHRKTQRKAPIGFRGARYNMDGRLKNRVKALAFCRLCKCSIDLHRLSEGLLGFL